MEHLLLNSLEYLYSFFGNYGLSIIAITLIIKMITLPLLIMSSKSAKQNEVNPIKVILPVIIQAPVYFILFSILSGTSFTGSFLWMTNLSAADPFLILPILACLSFALPIFLKKENELPNAMRKIQYILPVISFLFLYKMKAAVLLYMTTSSIVSLITTWGIEKFTV